MAAASQWQYRYVEDPFDDRAARHELFTESSEQWVFTTELGERDDDAELIIRIWEHRGAKQIVVASYGANRFGSRSADTVKSEVRFDREKPRRVDWSYHPDNESRQGGILLGCGKFPGGNHEFIWKMMEHQTLVMRFRSDLSNVRYASRSDEATHTLTFDLDGLADALDRHSEMVLPKRPSAFGRLRTGFKVALALGIVGLAIWVCSAVVF